MKLRTSGLALLPGLLFASNSAMAADGDVRLNSVGYLPDASKVASVTNGGTEFSLKLKADDSVALSGTLSAPLTDKSTSNVVRFADFSSVTTPGEYYLDVPSVGRSNVFRIGRTAYDEAFQIVMLGFYGWRSGTPVTIDLGTAHYELQAGHLKDGLLDFVGQPGVLKDGTGGWYDAGDYGKYTINGSFSLGMMLQAWEDFGASLEKVALRVPETGDARPDYLDELAYQYKWLFSMQFEDGQVSHKLDSYDFAQMTDTPVSDTQPRYFSPPGSAATAAFVAAMAKGARAFQHHDAKLSEQMLTAAKKSYAWLTANPANLVADMSKFKNQQYRVKPEGEARYRMWAAAEMWESTGDAAALAEFEKLLTAETDKVDFEFDWANPRNLGVFTYLRSKREGRTTTLIDAARAALVTAADGAVKNRNDSGYGRATGSYYWGVNGVVARMCLNLQVANQLAPKKEYVDTCLDQVGHLLGRNDYGRSQVTMLGANPPRFPHHRPSTRMWSPFPGLLVGGPNPVGTWLDDAEDYRTNEVAINWNAALTYALAGFVTTEPVPIPVPVGDAGAGSGGTKDAGSSGRSGSSVVDAGKSGSASGGSTSGKANSGSSGTTAATSGSKPANSGKATSGDDPSIETPEETPTSSAGGCGCRIEGPTGATRTQAAWAVGLAAVLALRSRRRRR